MVDYTFLYIYCLRSGKEVFGAPLFGGLATMCKIYSTGGSYTPGDEASMSWTGANCSKIVFDTSGISLPKDSSHLFSNFGGEVEGCQNLKTDNVMNMKGMFKNCVAKRLDLSKLLNRINRS